LTLINQVVARSAKSFRIVWHFIIDPPRNRRLIDANLLCHTVLGNSEPIKCGSNIVTRCEYWILSDQTLRNRTCILRSSIDEVRESSPQCGGIFVCVIT